MTPAYCAAKDDERRRVIPPPRSARHEAGSCSSAPAFPAHKTLDDFDFSAQPDAAHPATSREYRRPAGVLGGTNNRPD
jgi:hypothetical protein